MHLTGLRSALGWPAAARHLVLAAYGLLWVTVLCLRLLRLHRTQRLVVGLAALLARVRPRPRPSPEAVELVGWAVALAGRHVPGATCLPQALTAHALLVAHGAPSTLHVGVARRLEGRLEAHAWVQSMGRIVIGGAGAAERYASLLSMGSPRSALPPRVKGARAE